MKELEHHIVGYDPKTDRIALSLPVPKRYLKDVRDIAKVVHDDVDAVGSYSLENSQLRDLENIMEHELTDHDLLFFLEPIPEDVPLEHKA